MSRAIFFDRDGVINERRPDDYVTTWEEFHFLPDIFSVLPKVKALGYLAVVITNQRGVALGRMTLSAVEAIHARMQSELMERCGAAFDGIEICPHDNTDDCDCRKPKPGMILRAAQRFAVDLKSSWMIGDGERDVIAGSQAGCRTILVGPETATSASFACATLAEAGEIIVDLHIGEAA